MQEKEKKRFFKGSQDERVQAGKWGRGGMECRDTHLTSPECRERGKKKNQNHVIALVCLSVSKIPQ